jgi:hypothetical protein
MTLHRVLTDVKNLSYLFIAFTESHMLQNLKLALGKFRTGHGFRELGSDFRLKQSLSCGNFSDSFPDLPGICPFHQVTLGSSQNYEANMSITCFHIWEDHLAPPDAALFELWADFSITGGVMMDFGEPPKRSSTERRSIAG